MPKLGGSIRRRRSRRGSSKHRRRKLIREGIPAWHMGGSRRGRWGWKRSWKSDRKTEWKPRSRFPRGGAGGGHGPRRARLVRTLTFAGVGFGVGYFVSTTLVFPSPERPPGLQGVPELRGTSAGQALALLADSGLVAGRVDSVRHPVAPAGSIIGQSPLPGHTALPGAEVRLTLSLGPEIRSVPDVTRLRGVRATAALEAGGFVVRVDTVRSGLPAGRVVAIDPAPGTEVAMPGNVRLAVSLGPPTFPMPELSGLAEHEARSLLNTLGLVLRTLERRYSILNVNRVFGQYPEPNTDVQKGTAVRLIVGETVFRIPFDPIGPASSSSPPDRARLGGT